MKVNYITLIVDLADTLSDTLNSKGFTTSISVNKDMMYQVSTQISNADEAYAVGIITGKLAKQYNIDYTISNIRD